jgi:hypothetical protein
VPRTAAYDGTVATSPDPIFRRLAKRVDLRMRYQGKPGKFAADATLSDNSGWHARMPLVPPTPFSGPTFDRTVTLDLDAISKREAAAASVIGVSSTEVSIAVSAQVDSTGIVFTAPLRLTLSPVQLYLPQGPEKLIVTNRTHTEAVAARRVGPITAAAARSWTGVLLILAVGSTVGLYLAARRSGVARTRTEIERRYPQLLVHVEPMASPPGKPVVNVADFKALVKLAERYGQMILTWRRPDADDFVVRDEGITYRYRIPLDEPDLQNVEVVDRPNGAGSRHRRAASRLS